MKQSASSSSLTIFNAAKSAFFKPVLLSLLVLSSATSYAGVEVCPDMKSKDISVLPIGNRSYILSMVPGWDNKLLHISFNPKDAELKKVTIQSHPDNARDFGDAVSCIYVGPNKAVFVATKGTGLDKIKPKVPSHIVPVVTWPDEGNTLACTPSSEPDSCAFDVQVVGEKNTDWLPSNSGFVQSVGKSSQSSLAAKLRYEKEVENCKNRSTSCDWQKVQDAYNDYALYGSTDNSQPKQILPERPILIKD